MERKKEPGHACGHRRRQENGRPLWEELACEQSRERSESRGDAHEADENVDEREILQRHRASLLNLVSKSTKSFQRDGSTNIEVAWDLTQVFMQGRLDRRDLVLDSPALNP